MPKGTKIWIDRDGFRRVATRFHGVEHADYVLGGQLLEVLKFSSLDLEELADTLRVYARNRTLFTLTDRIAKLEQRSKARRVRAATKAA